jgi:hypothetical protein
MTRTILTLILAMLAAAVAAASATAADGYRSADSIVATAGGQSATVTSDPGSAKQLFAGSTADRPRSEVTAASGYRSADAIVAVGGPPQSTAPVGAQRYADAFARPGGSQLHPASSSPVRIVEVRGGDGFHWLDALIGALVAAGLLLIMFAAAGTITRNRRAAPASSA